MYLKDRCKIEIRVKRGRIWEQIMKMNMELIKFRY